MPTITYDVTNRSTIVGRQVSVMALTPAPLSGVSGTSVSMIGVFESFELGLKREYADTTGAADSAMTSRAIRWGKGSLSLTGFVRGVASAMAALFASGSHAILQLTEVATGDQYQVMCTCEDFKKAIGKETNKDTLTLGQEGIPFYAPSGGTLAAIPLEV